MYVLFQVASVKEYGLFVKIPGTNRQGDRTSFFLLT